MTEVSYRERATLHAPKTIEQINRAAIELAAAGHTDNTISEILRLNLEAVKSIVGRRRGG